MIKIRKSNSSDIPQLEALFLVTRQSAFYWESPEIFKFEDFKQSTSGETIFVAEEGTTIIGFISVLEKDAPLFIHHLFVAKEVQKKGGWKGFNRVPFFSVFFAL